MGTLILTIDLPDTSPHTCDPIDAAANILGVALPTESWTARWADDGIFDYASATHVDTWLDLAIDIEVGGPVPLAGVPDGWWLADPGEGASIGYLWGRGDTYDGLVELGNLTGTMGCQEVHAGDRIVRIQNGRVTEIAGFPPGVPVYPR